MQHLHDPHFSPGGFPLKSVEVALTEVLAVFISNLGCLHLTITMDHYIAVVTGLLVEILLCAIYESV